MKRFLIIFACFLLTISAISCALSISFINPEYFKQYKLLYIVLNYLMNFYSIITKQDYAVILLNCVTFAVGMFLFTYVKSTFDSLKKIFSSLMLASIIWGAEFCFIILVIN